jgi:hypothetical protein
MHLEEYQDFVGISLDWIIVEGYCRWKLSSRNLYTFLLDLTRNSCEKSNFRSVAGFEPAGPKFAFFPCRDLNLHFSNMFLVRSHGSILVYIHELVVRAQQLASVVCRVRFVFWRMKITADATTPLFLVYSEIWNATSFRVTIRLHTPNYESYTENRSMKTYL